MQIFRCDVTLLENTFFSSREVGNFYQTEPFIGNYALCYALGLATSPYFNDGTIHYGDHLAALNERDIYITPASILDQPRFSIEQFNALPDSYWYAMGNNSLVTKPDGWETQQRGSAWYLVERSTGVRRKVRTMNRPQIGRIKLLSINNRARFYLVSKHDAPHLPRYIRLGKWMSKARLDAKLIDFEQIDAANHQATGLLNPLDLPPTTDVHTFDLLSVHPVPLLRNAVLSGTFYRLEDGTMLPKSMQFGIDALTDDD